MIGISSSSVGVLLVPKYGTGEYAVLDVVEGKEQDPVEVQYLYSAAQDWEEIEGADANALLETATSEYWLARTVSLLRLGIGGLESSLEKRVLEHVEEILGSRVSSEKVLNRLLVAPLIDASSSVALAQSSLGYGFAAVASILDELEGLQPLLHRLTDLWLGLSETAFSHFSESRQKIWATVIEKCELKQLLRASSKREFTDKWNLLAFHVSTPQHRFGIQTLGQELSRRLFPQEVQKELITDNVLGESEPTRHDGEKRGATDYETFERVEKQIDAITQAVSEGRDAKAEKFLRELIQEQTSFSRGESYAVKSLCNIAKRCADMFRMDFEVACLKQACQLDRFDTWTLIQYGDHLKRMGSYEEALKVFSQAKQLGEKNVALSSIADVYSQQGEYAKAILTYKAIPNWNNDYTMRTAIADNLRKMGCMDESKAAYTELISLAQQGLIEFAGSEVRAQAGIAEIEKRQGKLEEALQIYNRIIEIKDIDDRDLMFYKLGLCNVLKLMDRFEDAYVVVDEVIQKFPFAMEARFIRGSILGLIGQELEGLKDLPESSGYQAWREWLRPYYRGLLLLKLKRYGDAKKNLVEELPKAIASGEEKAILCMAAALCFLREDDFLEVDRILSEIPDLYDCQAQYLSLVLKLHSATRQQDLATMNSLREKISGLQVVDARSGKAVVALGERNFPLALTYETDALLKLAA